MAAGDATVGGVHREARVMAALAPAEVDWGVAARRKASLARFRAALGDARDAATP